MRTNLLLAILACLGGCDDNPMHRYEDTKVDDVPVFTKQPICIPQMPGKLATALGKYKVCICMSYHGEPVQWYEFGTKDICDWPL